MTDTPNTAPELLPCPFCGSPMRFYRCRNTGKFGVSHDLNLSGQQDCILYSGLNFKLSKTREQAAAAWNTRANLSEARVKE